MKPPRNVDTYSQHGKTSPIPENIRTHLEKINKTLSKISFGTNAPDPANPGKTMLTNNAPDRNMDVVAYSGVSPGAADTSFTITHTLGRIPNTIFGQDTNNGGLLYRSPIGGEEWTKTTVTLRCTKASSAYIVYLG